MRTIEIASTAGFCGGVARSVAKAEATLQQEGRVYCLGELVHNADEVRRLESLGLITVQSADEVPAGAVVLIRCHGVAKEVYEALRAKGAEIVDATCDRVQNIQRLAARAGEQGRKLIVFGDPKHPEVQGICSWAPGSVAGATPSPKQFTLTLRLGL